MAEVELRFEGQSPADVAGSFAQLVTALNRRLVEAGEQIASRLERAAKQEAPVGVSGELRSSIATVVESVGQALVKVRLGSPQEYAAAQEFGTDPFFPPPSALREWARQVLGDADAAYPVARSISETGLDEQPFLRPAFLDNVREFVSEINDAVSRAFDDVGLT